MAGRSYSAAAQFRGVRQFTHRGRWDPSFGSAVGFRMDRFGNMRGLRCSRSSASGTPVGRHMSARAVPSDAYARFCRA